MRNKSAENVPEGREDSENHHPESQPSVATDGLVVGTKDGDDRK